jgi:hypothetical protein
MVVFAVIEVKTTVTPTTVEGLGQTSREEGRHAM